MAVDEGRPQPSFTWSSIILLVWLVGVLLMLVRFIIGVVAVRRLVARAGELTGTSWSELSAQLSRELRLKRPVRLMRSHKSLMPMTCGGWSSVVLLPSEADHWPADRRRVVVLHELIHIKRGDLRTQTLAQVACALYWFNPLVWWAMRRLRTEQEWACDERVVATGVKRADYATHLLAIARRFQADRTSAVTTTAMARASKLEERLCAILRADHTFGQKTVITIFVMSIVFLATANTQLVTAEVQNGFRGSTRANGETSVEQSEENMSDGSRGAVIDAPAMRPNEDNGEFRQSPSPTPLDRPAAQPAGSTPYSVTTPGTEDQPTEEQIFNNLSDEERRRLLSNGIGPAFITEMGDAGYRGLSVAQLIALYSNGVHADYVAALRSVGYSGLSTSDLLSLKTNGVTPAVIRSFQAATRSSFKATKYASMLSNGVTPSYVRSLSDAGYDHLTANEIIAMRLAGVTAEFIRDAQSRGNSNLSPNELIELKRREGR